VSLLALSDRFRFNGDGDGGSVGAEGVVKTPLETDMLTSEARCNDAVAFLLISEQ
jgi:hypothetical protein